MGKSWDTKKVNDFIEYLEHAAYNYMDCLGDVHQCYEDYINNETFVGQAADSTKTFIALKQKKFNQQQYYLSKEMVKRYNDLDETFKAIVDPAADAKINTDVVSKVKTHFMNQYDYLERIGCGVQQKTIEAVDRLGRYGCGLEEINFKNTIMQYYDHCGTGGFLDNCIKKVEEFDDTASTRVFNSGIKNAIQEHIEEVTDTSAGLDMIHTQAVDINKQTLSLISLSAGDIFKKVDTIDRTKTQKITFKSKLGNFDVTYYPADIKDFFEEYNINVNKLETNDGFFMYDKSLAEILEEAGVDPNRMDYKDYDDWYISGIVTPDGRTVYSMVKVREPMDSKGRWGTAVVFNSMSVDSIEEIIAHSVNGEEIDDTTIENARGQMTKISGAAAYPDDYDKDLLKYFRNTNSEASYLIADFTVDKVVHNEAFKDGVYELPYKYEDFDTYAGQAALDRLEEAGIYNKEKNTIIIKNPDSLSPDEKNAILLITTGDQDVYAYAAENEFHADNYGIPFLKENAISSGAGVGEGKENDGGDWYEKMFKPSNSNWYKKQYEAHGDH
jgi:hypothetical protein